MHWNKGSLTGKVEVVHVSKAKWGIHSPPTMDLAIPRKAGLHHPYWCRENKPLHSEHHCLPSSFSHTAEHTAIPYGISLWSVKSALSHLLEHLQPAPRWGGVRRRKGLGSVSKLFSNIQNTPVSLTLFPAQTQHTAPYQLQWRKLTVKTSTFMQIGYLLYK